MNKKKTFFVRYCLGLLAMAMTIFVFNEKPLAVDEVKSEIGYYYEIAHPENQVTKGNAINLKMAPGQEQKVPITVVSTSDQDIVVDLSLNGARTNGSGGLEYGPTEFAKDDSMVDDLPDIAKVPEFVEIPAKSKVTFDLEITMPKEKYSGIVTGGLRFMERDQESKGNNEGAEVVNKMAMLVGVTLFMDESPVEPSLDMLAVEAGLFNYHNSFNLKIANQAPKIMSKLTLSAEITRKGQKEILYKSFKNLIQMTPNSIMKYPILLDGNLIESGGYTANVIMEDDKDNKWEWNQDFTVTKEQAKKLNDESVGVTEEPTDWKLIALGGAVAALLLVIVFLIVKNKKKATK
ncbi:DUF916 and DUF3324 domain-containing protein [Vagococcus zengguangii]